MIIQAAAGFQKSQVGADVARSIRETNISRDQQVGTTIAGATKEKVMVAWESHAAKNDYGDAVSPRQFLQRFLSFVLLLAAAFKTRPSETAIKASIKQLTSTATA
jgi:hypothetical protein